MSQPPQYPMAANVGQGVAIGAEASLYAEKMDKVSAACLLTESGMAGIFGVATLLSLPFAPLVTVSVAAVAVAALVTQVIATVRRRGMERAWAIREHDGKWGPPSFHERAERGRTDLAWAVNEGAYSALALYEHTRLAPAAFAAEFRVLRDSGFINIDPGATRLSDATFSLTDLGKAMVVDAISGRVAPKVSPLQPTLGPVPHDGVYRLPSMSQTLDQAGRDMGLS